jgi:hypothetical protein
MPNTSLLITDNNAPVSFTRLPLSSRNYDENWIQQLLFENPSLLQTRPREAEIVPVCRELALRGSGNTVFLDIFAVRTNGKPVLIECKLWRNPQARREVIGQILEYASILKGYNYADLQALLMPKLDNTSNNSIYDLVKALDPSIEESLFVDQCDKFTQAGEFDLIIAGDGIRSGLSAVKELLERDGGIGQNLQLLEIQLSQAPNNQLLVQSSLQSTADVLQITPRTDSISPEQPDSPKGEWREVCTKFWNAFLEAYKPNHPDQPPLRRQGSYNVMAAMPSPMRHISCYRVKSSSSVGVFVQFENDATGTQLFNELQDRQDELQSHFTGDLTFDEAASWNDRPHIVVSTDKFAIEEESTTPGQIEFLSESLDSMVMLMRNLSRQN